MADFYNTYHFVPVHGNSSTEAPTTEDFDKGSLGGMDHSSYQIGSFSGRIICSITTESPIVVGAERVKVAGQPATVKPFMIGGKPAIPGSSLRGMFSSLAEAASNSALRILDNTELSVKEKTSTGFKKRRIGSIHEFFDKVDPELLPMNPARNRITVAEQLFGFVEDGGDPAGGQKARCFRGKVRFSDARCFGLKGPDGKMVEEPEYFDHEVPLKILGCPKPPCPSMYFKKANATQDVFIGKTDLRAGTHWPQGRKFYLHHQASAQGQLPPWQTQDNSPDTAEMKSVVTPVKKGAIFVFSVDFDNLNEMELGLLLYAIRPTDKFRHLIGMGKPIGLGRVVTDIRGVFLIDRKSRYTLEGFKAGRYSRVNRMKKEGRTPLSIPAKRFPAEAGAEETNPVDVDKIRQAWLSRMNQACRNAIEFLGNPDALDPTCPVSTPLRSWQANSERETFKWFVQNDRDRDQHLTPIGNNPRENIKLKKN